MAERRERRSQQERSAETSTRLLEAAIDLLHDRGISRMPTPDIAAYAGVSRGALTHHFASREDLVTSAIARMLSHVTEGLFRFAEDINARGGTSDEIVDYLWTMMSDRLFYVTMEYLPEARHNDDFRARLVPVVKDFHSGLDAIWMALATSRGTDPERTRTVMTASMCMIRGMIAQTVLRDDPAYFAGLLDFWKEQARQHFPDKPVKAAGRRVKGQAA
ncbi:MAG: TetR/AcrR family transcriptional regulator [Phreatobacter sp.]